MTTANASTSRWSSIPGWGIAADLTPPELINSRQLKLLRRLLAGALVALLLVCTGAYVLAARQNSSATQSLEDVQARTRGLQANVRKYAAVTQIQGSVTTVQAQIATLMGGDVDLVKLIGLTRSRLPRTMTISSELITINLAAVASTTASASGLDTSGLARIGNVTITGTGRRLDDLATYVDALKVLPGVVNVMPGSNTASAAGSQFSLTLGLTSVLISHRFDVPAKGSK